MVAQQGRAADENPCVGSSSTTLATIIAVLLSTVRVGAAGNPQPKEETEAISSD